MRNCPACGARSPTHDTRDVPYTYKSQTTLIPAVTGYYCASCEEITLDHNAVDRYIELINAFEHQVNNALADPAAV